MCDAYFGENSQKSTVQKHVQQHTIGKMVSQNENSNLNSKKGTVWLIVHITNRAFFDRWLESLISISRHLRILCVRLQCSMRVASPVELTAQAVVWDESLSVNQQITILHLIIVAPKPNKEDKRRSAFDLDYFSITFVRTRRKESSFVASHCKTVISCRRLKASLFSRQKLCGKQHKNSGFFFDPTTIIPQKAEGPVLPICSISKGSKGKRISSPWRLPFPFIA